VACKRLNEKKKKEEKKKLALFFLFSKDSKGEIDPPQTYCSINQRVKQSIGLLFIDLFLEPERIQQVYQKERKKVVKIKRESS